MEIDQQRLVLELAFSDLLFSCASTSGSLTASGKRRRHHWGWVADNVIPKQVVEHDAIAGFRARINYLSQISVEDIEEPILFQSNYRELPILDSVVELCV